ncbi:MAG: serine O-acetyltransferase [Alphaproteobacteria bacterium]
MAQTTSSSAAVPQIKPCDPVWDSIKDEARQVIASEPALAGFLNATILSHTRLEQAMATRLAQLLESADLGAMYIRGLFDEAYKSDNDVCQALRADIATVMDRDPACHRYLEPILYFKGFQAIQSYRVAHWLWHQGRKDMALFVQSRGSKVFGVDIHPAAKIGRGIFVDHATGVVIGETAVVGDNVSLLHGVTLGGTGKEGGDRHPKVGYGVMIGAGAKILGNIEIGCCSRIAAGSVVLKSVPKETTVAGVPAKVVGKAGCAEPSRAMNQVLEEQG